MNYALAGLLIFYSASNIVLFFIQRKQRKFKHRGEQAWKLCWKEKAKWRKNSTLALAASAILATVVAMGGSATATPSGAFWNDGQNEAGTTITAGSTQNPYCTVWNNNLNRAESGASCTVALAPNGCSVYNSNSVDVYLKFTFQGILLNTSNLLGQGLSVRFSTNLQTLGCSTPGLNWNSTPGPGILAGNNVTFSTGYKCAQLPQIDGSTSYSNANATQMYLGKIWYKRTQGSISCLTGN